MILRAERTRKLELHAYSYQDCPRGGRVFDCGSCDARSDAYAMEDVSGIDFFSRHHTQKMKRRRACTKALPNYRGQCSGTYEAQRRVKKRVPRECYRAGVVRHCFSRHCYRAWLSVRLSLALAIASVARVAASQRNSS